MKEPEKFDITIFRENTEDVYSGFDYEANSPQALKLIELINSFDPKKQIREFSGIGIKPVSKLASERLIRSAIEYALNKGLKKVHLIHKGNIMKYTEGSFKDWGYELVKREFPNQVITEEEIWDGAKAESIYKIF